MFVDRIVEDLVNQMVHSAFVRISDEHSWPFSDCFEPFELVDLCRIVLLCCGDSSRGTHFFDRNFLLNLRHKKWGQTTHTKSITEKGLETTNNLVVCSGLFALLMGAEAAAKPIILW